MFDDRAMAFENKMLFDFKEDKQNIHKDQISMARNAAKEIGEVNFCNAMQWVEKNKLPEGFSEYRFAACICQAEESFKVLSLFE